MKMPEGSEYVALGSSYAAGPGLGNRAPGSPRRAGRSTNNYAHVLAERLGLRLMDVSFSGATVSHIIGRVPGASAIPQLDAVNPNTRLVTLTGGGNDLGYIGYLLTASLPSLVRTLTGGDKRLAEFGDAVELDKRASALGDDLIALVDEIRSRAPHATVIVTDYLSLLPTEGTAAHPLGRESVDRGRRYFSLVNLTLRQAAARAGALFVDVATASAAHHAWADDPWTERFVLFGGRAAAYHPNRDGMIEVANALETALSNA